MGLGCLGTPQARVFALLAVLDDAIKPLVSYSMCSSFVEFYVDRVLPDPRVL